MTFSYAAGSATPDYSGLFEIPAKSLRICNVGTGSPLVLPSFKPLVIPPLISTCPIRYNMTPIPRGGASVAEPAVDSWQFDIRTWFFSDDVDDIWGAFDYLCDVVCVANGWMGAELNAPTWTDVRTMTVRKGGQVTMNETDKGEMGAGYREFTLPFIAADPIKYAKTQTSTVITSGTTVTNAGNAKVPYLVRFDGGASGVTDHIQIDGPSGDKTVLLDYALPAGKFIEINTRDGSYLTDTGVDMNPYIAVGADVRLLAPDGNSFTKSSGGGTGVATVKHYSGWE